MVIGRVDCIFVLLPWPHQRLLRLLPPKFENGRLLALRYDLNIAHKSRFDLALRSVHFSLSLSNVSMPTPTPNFFCPVQ